MLSWEVVFADFAAGAETAPTEGLRLRFTAAAAPVVETSVGVVAASMFVALFDGEVGGRARGRENETRETRETRKWAEMKALGKPPASPPPHHTDGPPCPVGIRLLR
jgi:hypothetical protein